MASDEELMVAARDGATEAFGRLVQRHQSSAWQTAYRFTGDATEAEDLAQEAFLRIFDGAGRYQPTASFRTFLYRVVTRLCLDHVQKKRPLYVDAVPEVSDHRPAPVEVLTLREQKQDILQALHELPPNQRLAVILRYYEGLGYTEIAAALEVSPKAAERLLARARSTLEKRLDHFLERA
jgi:RNA polymerase sigma-70 factor (ECF subfamily)